MHRTLRRRQPAALLAAVALALTAALAGCAASEAASPSTEGSAEPNLGAPDRTPPPAASWEEVAEIAIEEDGELLEGEWLLGARCLRSGDGVTFRADNGGDGLLLVVDGYDLLADESSLNHESAAYGLDELNLVSRGNPVVLEGPAVVDRSLPTDEPLQVRLRIEATCG